ncbi:MAG: FAD-dependent thymidylate synthase [Capsulimonadales bacterium]|nr:FAD-dependent thymidylate synthase [Capsulimonadales bacterium]
MKVTQVSLRPTDAAQEAGRPALTPELLAAVGARYSRNNEGLEAILEKIDPENADASVERIFRFVDYGHASIADMAPVALFIDGISLYLAYYLWTLCPTAGGQESSTRYIRLNAEGLADPETLGIPENERAAWNAAMEEAFAAYQSAVTVWEEIVRADPDVARIPRSLREDPSEKSKKAVARMRRNYAFDRARYFLPVAATTNVMLVQSARAWVNVCQYLLSHPLREANLLGERLRDELALAAPNLLRHARPLESLQKGLAVEQLTVRKWAEDRLDGVLFGANADGLLLEVFLPPQTIDPLVTLSLAFHDNRYSYIGATLRRTAVRFGWNRIAFAEIRDLNRHRTGTKYCPLLPQGFYAALDELPSPDRAARIPVGVGVMATNRAHRLLTSGEATYIYHTLLGTEFPFEHTTTADKFIYEAELRTGVGAHYRYAGHLRDILALWYERFPATKGLILEGSAEPE